MNSRDYHSGYYRREPPPIPPHSHPPPPPPHPSGHYHTSSGHHGRGKINQHPVYQEKQGRPSFSPTPDSGYRNNSHFINNGHVHQVQFKSSRRPWSPIFFEKFEKWL